MLENYILPLFDFQTCDSMNDPDWLPNADRVASLFRLQDAMVESRGRPSRLRSIMQAMIAHVAWVLKQRLRTLASNIVNPQRFLYEQIGVV
jgi:hypothetical protein